jgi:hypothetical protein
LGILAQRIRLEGFEVCIVNLNNEILKACINSRNADEFSFISTWKTFLATEVGRFNPDFIGVTCLFHRTHEVLVQVCEEFNQLAPNTALGIGGIHITNSLLTPKASEKLINDLGSIVNAYFLYESDITFKEFLLCVNRKAPIKGLAQIIFNTSDGNLIQYPQRRTPDAKELNIVPAQDLMSLGELSDYGQIGGFSCFREPGTKFSAVLASRGCRARCSFCSVRNFNGKKVRRRSIQSVIDELLLLRYEHGVEHIVWLDDDFLYNEKDSVALFNEMVRQNVDITWDNSNGVIASSCTDEVISAAAESGCLALFWELNQGTQRF